MDVQCDKLGDRPSVVRNKLTVFVTVDVRSRTSASLLHGASNYVYSTVHDRQHVARVYVQQLMYLYVYGASNVLRMLRLHGVIGTSLCDCDCRCFHKHVKRHIA